MAKKTVKKKSKPAAQKPVKKAAPKKAAPKKVAAKPVKKAAAPKKPVAKVAAPKKVVAKPVAPAKAAKAAPVKKAATPQPAAPKKAEKPEKVLKGKAAKVAEPVEEVVEPEVAPEEESEEIVLTDADGRRYCRVKDCDQLAAVDAYCRYHYLLFWKKIQVRKKILTEGKLERYIEELTARYPDKFLDMLRKDLRSEKEFLAAIQELEIDESAVDNEFEDEAQTYIDEVRGDVAGTERSDEDF